MLFSTFFSIFTYVIRNDCLLYIKKILLSLKHVKPMYMAFDKTYTLKLYVCNNQDLNLIAFI